MKKNICIFTSHYFPYLGGVESYTYHLCRELVKNGNKVVIFTNNDMKLKAVEKMDGIPVVRIPCFNLMGGRYPVTKMNGEFFRLWKKLRKIHFDLVVINTRFYPHTVLGTIFAKLEKTKCIILDHGTSHMTVENPLADFLFACVEHGITMVDRMLCKNYYGVSQACCKWLEHFHIRSSGVLYNAVDAESIRQKAENPVRNFRKEYGIEGNEIVIAYVSRLIKEKGIFELLDAVDLLDEELKIHLMIAGDGDEMEAVKECQNHRIHALGRLNREEVSALLGQSEIFCFPTKYPEGFPTVVLEAAAAGCYVITTNKGGSAELIRDDTYGKILENPGKEEISRAILHAVKHPEERMEAAGKGRKLVEECFTWKQTAGQLEKLAE